VGYLMLDIKRRQLGVRDLVTHIENAIIAVLASYDIPSHARSDAPGVYVPRGAKIAQLGLRVRRGCSFHGLSLNMDMDLEPFRRINPCGYAGMEVTSMAQESASVLDLPEIETQLNSQLCQLLGYTEVQSVSDGVLPSEFT